MRQPSRRRLFEAAVLRWGGGKLVHEEIDHSACGEGSGPAPRRGTIPAGDRGNWSGDCKERDAQAALALGNCLDAALAGLISKGNGRDLEERIRGNYGPTLPCSATLPTIFRASI